MSDQQLAAAKVQAVLGKGERVLLSSWTVATTATGGTSWAAAEFWPLIWLHRRQVARRDEQQRSASAGFAAPLVGALLLTDRRLLFWSASRVRLPRRGFRLGELVGDAQRSDVHSVTNSSVGHGWRTLDIVLDDGRELTRAVPARQVAAWVEAFAAEDQ